jgi:hypothetical protein
VRFNDLLPGPADSLGNDLDDQLRSTLSWNVGMNYRIGLIGSTTLRPRVSVDGALFRSDSTSRDFISVPTRFNIGVVLTTDIFGFFPGFGPFSSIRHKISPQIAWTFAPAVSVPDSIAGLPGFPVRAGSAQNRLTINFNQTFEAKLKRRVQEQLEEEQRGRPGGEEGIAEPAGEPPAGEPPAGELPAGGVEE